MKLRRILSLALAAGMSLSLAAAHAETTVTPTSYSFYDAELNQYTNTLIVREARGSIYKLMDAQGNMLTSEPYIYMRSRDAFVEVAVSEGINTLGAIDCTGKQIVPMEYGDISYLSDRWTVGVVLEPATEENYDYTTFMGQKSFFLVARYDVFFCGNLVGSFTRNEYKSGTAHGNYLVVRSLAGDYAAYDSQLTKSPLEITSSSEYYDDYRAKVVYHVGTGMPAFTEGCTLTADEVEKPFLAKDDQLLDLQGNVIAPLPYYTTYSFYGDYAYVRDDNNMYGMIDKTGKLIIPFELDDNLYASGDTYFATGYQVVSKDGKLCWAAADGTITFASDLGSGVSYRNYGAFACVQDNDGKYMIVTPLGQLAARYPEISGSYHSIGKLLAVQNDEQQAGVIGMAGEEIIALDGTYDNAYDLSISNDGTLVLGNVGYNNGLRDYILYTVSYDATGLEVPAVDDGSWTCPSCANKNTGKFCPECGTPKP